MTRAALLALLLVAAPTPDLPAPADPSAYRLAADLPRGGAGEFVKIHVSAEVFRAARPGLADLRLVDGDGAEVGYALRRSQAAPPPPPARFRVEGYEKTEGEAFVSLAPSETGAVLIEAVEVFTPARDFYLPCRIEGRLGDAPWRTLARGALYDHAKEIDLRRTTIEFPAAEVDALRLVVERPRAGAPADLDVEYGDLRLSLRQTDVEAIRFDGFAGRRPPSDVAAEIDAATVSVRSAGEEDGTTLLEFDGGNLPAASVDVGATDPLYARRVVVEEAVPSDRPGGAVRWREIGAGPIRRFRFAGRTEDSNVVSLPGRPIGRARLRIERGANRPLRVGTVTLRWPRTWIIALRRDDMRLLAGGPPGPAPRYDVDALVAALPPEALPEWGPGPLRENLDYEEPGPEVPVRPLMAAAAVALALGLLGWTAWLLRRSQPDRDRP